MVNRKERIEARRHQITYVEMYEVSADELDRLQYEEPHRSHELSLALAALSTALALLIPQLIGNPPSMSDRRFEVILIIIILGFAFFLFFGIRWLSSLISSRKRRKLLFERIRTRQIGPVGEEGTEIPAEQLPELPSEDASGSQDAGGSESKG